MKKGIFLLGDLCVHWNIVPTSNGKNVYIERRGETSTNKILNVLQTFFNKYGQNVDWSLIAKQESPGEDFVYNIENNAINRSMVHWKQFNEGKNKVWRVQSIDQIGQSNKPVLDTFMQDEIEGMDLIIVQDMGLTIRELEFPEMAKVISDKWLIYCWHTPLFEGKLWQEIQKSPGYKNVIIVQADDLRKLNTSISKGLSWEQTVEDITNEIFFKRNISLHSLRTSEYVIISFGCTGMMLIHNFLNEEGKQPEIKFFFDAMGIEGYFEKDHPGSLPGEMELFAALLAKEILYPGIGDEIQLGRAIRAHLLCRRELITVGANVSEGSLQLDCLENELIKVYGAKLAQDFTPVVLDFSLFQTRFESQKTNGSCVSRDWSFLGMTKWDLYSLARQISLYGPMKALLGWNIPIAKYNFLLTVDRKEIEFLHHLKTLISEYLQNRSSQPLSIAVFGSPGSGKSFSIKQLAKALNLPDQEIKDITFNLSQFNEDNPGDLYQAFHAVRDISLSGKTPLVFWDEFDSKNLAWLRYFLAPMQDGEFQEGQLTHNIGKSIFVFAGGTCACMEEFEVKAHTAVPEKGPDFLSRVKGFINVMGPNPVISFAEKKASDFNSDDEFHQLGLAKNADPEYIIRRAILINSLLQIGYKHLFKNGVLQIDDGVLNALLMVPKFKHGTRSMETIFKTSQLFNKEKYHRSDLPPESQMNLHVDGQQFYELMSQMPKYYNGGKAFYYLVNEIAFDEQVVQKMAVGIHAIYTLLFSSGKEQNPLAITKEEFQRFYGKMSDLPEEMPHDEVSQNYHNARKVPEKLSAVGYMIVPLETKMAGDSFSEQDFEKFSRLEHIRWVRHHIDAGWSYSPTKQKTNKLHDALVAWDEEERKNADAIYGKNYIEKMGIADGELLSEHYRNLDRVITLAIPWILENAGYKMVKL